MEHACSRMGLVIDLYVLMRISLFLPHVVPVSALYILIVLYALDLVYLMCSANVSFGLRFKPSILGNGL